MTELRVWNKHYETPEGEFVYIGRPSKWGNPFSHLKSTKAEFKVKDRETAVEEYRRWLLNQPELIEQAKSELKGKHLLCWCHPAPCHGNVLIEVANMTGSVENDYFALVGSREGHYEDDLKVIKEAGRLIADVGFGISSGDAIGTDRIFHEGCMESSNYHNLNHRIYVVDFNGNRGNRADFYGHFIDASKLEMRDEAIKVAQSVVPHFNYIKPYAQDLQTRNVYQVLGSDLQTPVKALIYWAPPKGNLDDEIVTGGTNTALQLAKHFNIEYRLNLFGKTPKEMILAVEELLLKLDPKETIEVIRISKDSPLMNSVNIDLDNDVDFSIPKGDLTGEDIKKYNDKMEATIYNNKDRWIKLLELDKLIVLESANKNYFNLFFEHLKFVAFIYNKEINYVRPEFDN